jgi:hypothetical protein
VKRSRFTEEQIIAIPREQEAGTSAHATEACTGFLIAETCSHAGQIRGDNVAEVWRSAVSVGRFMRSCERNC